MCKREIAVKQVQKNTLSLGDRVKLILTRRRPPALELEESRTYTYTIKLRCMYRKLEIADFDIKCISRSLRSVKQPVGQVPRVTVWFHCSLSTINAILRILMLQPVIMSICVCAYQEQQ